YPDFQDLMMLKISGDVFSTSDYQHPVITPIYLLVSQYLTQCRIRNEKDAAAGLFLCNLMLEYHKVSKRVMPEIIDFIQLILWLFSPNATTKKFITDRRFTKSFWVEKQDNQSENLENFEEIRIAEILMDRRPLNETSIRIAIIKSASIIALSLSKLYIDSGAYIEIFTPVFDALSLFDDSMKVLGPVKDSLNETRELLQNVIKSKQYRQHLTLQKRKPLAISSMVPKISQRFSSGAQGFNKSVADESRFKNEYKREMKGAIRELKKDARFISRQRNNERKSKDAVYNKKMAKIYGNLSQQEGDMRVSEKKANKGKGRGRK
ncbi:nucleolar complex protein 14, partial [Nowakowskiella sp. JEL0078]